METTNEVVIQAAPYVKTQDGTYVKTPDATTALTSARVSVAEGVWVNVPEIDTPEYARKHQPEGVDSLSVDMSKNGQLQNIVLVRKTDGRYECIIGNGRLAAARKIAWEKIRADVKEGLSEFDKLRLTMAENSEREDVSPFYTAGLYQKMKTAKGIEKGVELAAELGKDPSVVCRFLALAELAPEVQEKLARANFSMGQLREILRLNTPEERLKMAEACEKGDWSCKVLKTKVNQALAGNPQQVSKDAAGGSQPQAEEGPFQFVRKGKFLNIRTAMPATVDEVDEVYMRALRIALADFVMKEDRMAKAA